MTNALYNNGELQILQDALSSEQHELGLYNDSTDSLGESATLSDITTEPNTGGDYARQSISGFNVSLNTNDNAQAIAPEVTFNVSSNTQTVDSVFVVNTATGELVFTSGLQQSRDLSSIDNFVNNDTGLILD